MSIDARVKEIGNNVGGEFARVVRDNERRPLPDIPLPFLEPYVPSRRVAIRGEVGAAPPTQAFNEALGMNVPLPRDVIDDFIKNGAIIDHADTPEQGIAPEIKIAALSSAAKARVQQVYPGESEDDERWAEFNRALDHEYALVLRGRIVAEALANGQSTVLIKTGKNILQPIDLTKHAPLPHQPDVLLDIHSDVARCEPCAGRKTTSAAGNRPFTRGPGPNPARHADRRQRCRGVRAL